MKKLISILAIMAVLFASLFTLTGCGDEEESSSKKSKNKEENTVESRDSDKDEDEDDDKDEDKKNDNKGSSTKSTGKVNIKDKNSYYFVVNGEKFTTDSKVKDIASTGLVQDSSAAETDIQKNTYLIGGGYFRDSNKRTVFSVMPINNTSETIKCADANVGGFTLDEYYYKDYNGTIEICNGITIGSTVEELEAAFGEPTEKDMREEYENLGIKYNYKAGIYQYFEFEIDKENKTVTEITWRYFEN